MKNCLLTTVIIIHAIMNVNAQFAPQVGVAGTTAIHKDSSVFVNWATGCVIQRGWQDIADTTMGKVQVGDETYVPGKAGNGVVSLGDGGIATLTFEKPITNGTGYDFAVFENGFIDQTFAPGSAFLELAFVEVSSDGVNFTRFNSTCNINATSQVGTFEGIDAVKINNLAGKYIANYGTPFDLEELDGTPNLDIHNITHVRIIDVVGSINSNYARYDGSGNIVNDPYPTPFASGGFDLDAVGVIHQSNFNSVTSLTPSYNQLTIFPNPATTHSVINLNTPDKNAIIACYDITGRIVDITLNNTTEGQHQLIFSQPGVYFIKCTYNSEHIINRVVIQ